MGCEGNSPGGHFLQPRCYNYSNSADAWFQQDLTRSGDNSHSSPTPGIPRDKGAPRSLAGMKIHTSDFCPAVRSRRVHITSVRGGPHSSGPPVASSLPLLLKMEREIREGRAFRQSSRRPIIPFTPPPHTSSRPLHHSLVFVLPPPFPPPDGLIKGSMTVRSENQTGTVAVC